MSSYDFQKCRARLSEGIVNLLGVKLRYSFCVGITTPVLAGSIAGLLYAPSLLWVVASAASVASWLSFAFLHWYSSKEIKTAYARMLNIDTEIEQVAQKVIA